jgi:hypothetical protein
VKIGPVRAVAAEAFVADGQHEVHVNLIDVGAGRLVAFVSATARRLASSR